MDMFEPTVYHRSKLTMEELSLLNQMNVSSSEDLQTQLKDMLNQIDEQDADAELQRDFLNGFLSKADLFSHYDLKSESDIY